MCGLNIGDSKWLRTFPQVVAPLQDERLCGLLWRCDEANGWPLNTTKSMILPPRKNGMTPWANDLTGEGYDLDKLEELLDVPLPLILNTTFKAAHLRLIGKHYPKFPGFWIGAGLRICPACIGDTRLIRLYTALPIGHCPIHKLVLQNNCSCGAYLFDSRGVSPFTCYQCGLDWKYLPCERVDPQRLATDEHYLSLYAFFLKEATWFDFERILFWLYEEHFVPQHAWQRKEGWRAFFLQYFPSLRWTANYDLSSHLSLPELIFMLVDIGATLRDVELIAKSVPRSERSCLNHACSLFGLTDADNIGLFGYYETPQDKNEEPIWYCKECGSCYLNYRLCFTFDHDCSGNDSPVLYPSEHFIGAAQWQLSVWQDELGRVCNRKVKQGKEIDLKEVFEEANIPWKPNLVAPRLGLVEIVEAYVRLQQKRKPKGVPKHTHDSEPITSINPPMSLAELSKIVTEQLGLKKEMLYTKRYRERL